MTTTQLTLRVAAPTRDPHVVARRYVLEAIETCARHNGGRVSLNDVRATLTAVGANIPRGVTGSTVQSLKRAGRLVPAGVERSDDVAGGNAGRLIETYQLVGGAA
jgi:hypothetical protein